MSAFGFFITGTHAYTHIYIHTCKHIHITHTHTKRKGERFTEGHAILKKFIELLPFWKKLPLCKSYNKLSGKVTL